MPSRIIYICASERFELVSIKRTAHSGSITRTYRLDERRALQLAIVVNRALFRNRGHILIHPKAWTWIPAQPRARA